MSRSYEMSCGEVVSSVKFLTSNGSVVFSSNTGLPFMSSIAVSTIDKYVVSSEIAKSKSFRISSESYLENVKFNIVESSIVKLPPVKV